MGHKNGEKWVAAVNLQPMFPKSDSLLDVVIFVQSIIVYGWWNQY